MQYSIINYSHHTIHHIPWSIYFITGNLYIWPPSSTFPMPYLLPLVNTSLSKYLWVCLVFLFCFLFLDPTYKCEHVVFVFLCLAYFTWHNALKVHPCFQKWQDFLLSWLNNIPLYIYAPHLLYPFICFWILRLFPRFWLLSNAATSKRVQISFQISVFILFG